MSDMEVKDVVLDHKHPMTLKAELQTYKPRSLCYACGLLVTENAYFCSECNILIHTGCAKLPLQITHPMHSEHTLVLTYRGEISGKYIYCNSCWRFLSKCFMFRCLPCKFHICVSCALSMSKERIVTHNCHQHPLLIITKKARFHCNACDEQVYRDWPTYMCTTCPFWIHGFCASLSTTYESKHHDHPLSLGYRVPHEFLHYEPYCEVCYETLEPLMWVYFCGRCRYFVHIKCRQNSPEKRKDAYKYQLGADDVRRLIQFPWKDMSADVIRPFIKNKCHTQVQPLNEIFHFSHEHPLNLCGIKGDDDKEILCDGCIEPISTPYYCCDRCGYMLHMYCGHLPKELQHPTHPDHQLVLKKLKQDVGYFHCRICHTKSNGFFFECEACDFQIDIHCAVLPKEITHAAHHQHPLLLRVTSRKFSPQRPCSACGKKMSGLGYYCGYCIGFHVHYHCATLPPTVKHRWDKHQLALTYPPFGDHPDEMYCEICEEEIYPKHWMYHCRVCDQCFHPFCIPQISKDRYIKFGETIQVHDHDQHLLTSIREGRFKSKCARCGNNLSGVKGFECGLCRFSLCYECVRKIPPKPNEGVTLPGLKEQQDYGMLYGDPSRIK